MERLTLTQEQRRRQAESAIGIAAPFLDIMLAVGEKVSRFAEPVDYEYYPVRAPEGADYDRSTRVSAAARTVDDQ